MSRFLFALIVALSLLISACSESPPSKGEDTDKEPPPEETLNAPTGLAADPSPGKVTLHWSDQSEEEAGFEIERSADKETFTLLDTVATNITRYTDSDVEANTTYAYRVRAARNGNVSTYSNEVGYAPLDLEQTNDPQTFSAGNVASESGETLVGFSDHVFTGTTAQIDLSTSSEPDGELPEALIPFGPRITVSIPAADIDLDANDDTTGTEIVVMPERSSRELPEGSNPFAFVRVETQGEPFTFTLPYDPTYPEFPIEIDTFHLQFADREDGLTDPIRFHVYPVYEAEMDAARLDPQVTSQTFGLFELPEETDYNLYDQDCKDGNRFWHINPVQGTQELNGKTPLVLVHGWQAISNIRLAYETIWNYEEFTPYVCSWLEFLDTYRNEHELHEAYELYTFSYDSDRRVEDSALQLAGELEEAFDTPAVIVGHSMGGLVASIAERTHDTSSIDFVVTLGTSYRGSPVISCYRVSNGTCDVARLSPGLKDDIIARLSSGRWDKIKHSAFIAYVTGAAFNTPGGKDLTFEGPLTNNDIEDITALKLRCEWNPEHATETLMGCTLAENIENPYLKELNTSNPPGLDTHFAFVGRITKGEESGDQYYDIINAAVEEEYGFATDGVVSVESARVGPLDGTAEPLLPYYLSQRTHHSALIGQNLGSHGNSPLPEIMEKLDELSGVEEPVDRCDEQFCVEGSVESWSWGPAEVTVFVSIPQSEEIEIIAETELTPDKSFEMVLPDLSGDTPLFVEESPFIDPSECTGEITANPDTFRVNTAAFAVHNDETAELIHLVSGSTSTFTMVVFYYADREVTITGTSRCTNDGEQDTQAEVDMHLSHGWNTLVFEAEYNDEGIQQFSVTTDSIPPDTAWRLGSEDFITEASRRTTSLRTLLPPH